MTNLKRIIDEKGVQQRWLAEQVGVTEVSMSRYVSGDRIPKAPLAIRMADVLGVDVKELYRWEPEERTRERTETHACDCINRKDAIDAHYEYCNKHPDAGFPVWSLKILEDLPPAQPEHTNSCYTNSWCIDCKEYDTESKCCPRYNRVIKQTLDEVYAHAETEAEARFHAELVRCKDCKHQVKEWRTDKRLKDNGYMVCGCDVVGDACGYWALLGQDDDYCSMAERKTDEKENI